MSQVCCTAGSRRACGQENLAVPQTSCLWLCPSHCLVVFTAASLTCLNFVLAASNALRRGTSLSRHCSGESMQREQVRRSIAGLASALHSHDPAAATLARACWCVRLMRACACAAASWAFRSCCAVTAHWVGRKGGNVGRDCSAQQPSCCLQNWMDDSAAAMATSGACPISDILKACSSFSATTALT